MGDDYQAPFSQLHCFKKDGRTDITSYRDERPASTSPYEEVGLCDALGFFFETGTFPGRPILPSLERKKKKRKKEKKKERNKERKKERKKEKE